MNRKQTQIDPLEILKEENASDVENIQEFQELTLEDGHMPSLPNATAEYELRQSAREKRLTLKAKERSSELTQNICSKCSGLDWVIHNFSQKNLSALSVQELTDTNCHLEVGVLEMISSDCP